MNKLIPNTFGLKVKADEYLEYASVDELMALLPKLQGRRWFHVGGGSNLLFTSDFHGIILHSAIRGIEEVKRVGTNVWLKVGAGMVWDDLVDYAVQHGLYGAENLSLIPGEVGASAVQNIGAYGVEAAQLIEEVTAVEAATGRVRTFANAGCRYAYRSSIFKHELKGRYIITHVTYRFSTVFSPDLEYGAIRRVLESNGLTPEALTAAQLRQLIIGVRRVKLPDPAETGSAGSFFMNPVVSREKCESLLAQYPTMPHYEVEGGVKIPAGWMIEQCGWKGRALGHAGVYEKQALVLVNLGGATGQEIVALSDAVRADVKAKFGIDIHPEAIIIG